MVNDKGLKTLLIRRQVTVGLPLFPGLPLRCVLRPIDSGEQRSREPKEQEGLLKPTAHSEAGHRLYGAEEVAQLQFIKRANLAGITKVEVKELLALIAKEEGGENVPHLKEVLEEKIREAARTIEEISALRDSLLYYRGRFEEKEQQG